MRIALKLVTILLRSLGAGCGLLAAIALDQNPVTALLFMAFTAESSDRLLRVAPSTRSRMLVAAAGGVVLAWLWGATAHPDSVLLRLSGYAAAGASCGLLIARRSSWMTWLGAAVGGGISLLLLHLTKFASWPALIAGCSLLRFALG